MGQASQGSAQSGTPSDWTHHHVIFSKPATAEETRRVQQDPRYWQQIRRQSPIVPEVDTRRVLNTELRVRPHLPSPIKNPSKIPGLDRDWAIDLGSGASIGAGNYPAKYSFDTSTANCTTDFVVYPTGLTGVPGPTTGQASIVAYSNLYSGCGAVVPSVYWAYDTAEGTIQNSPVFSVDGTQLAFVQADASGNGELVLLKWAALSSESIGSPDSLSAVGHSSYFGCSAPCMDTFPLRHLRGNDTDTNSSIFYDYSSDTAYVGDDSGVLHQFNPVFKGTPAEVTAGAWPVEVNPTNPTPLASPVFDSGTGNVFVTDEGGFLYSVTSAGVVTTSGQLDYSFANDGGPGIVEGPVVNSTAGFLYVFAASDNTSGCLGGLAHFSAVYELSTTFVALDTGSEATVGCSTIPPATPSPLYVGAFDSTYVNSVAPAATGHVYVCGYTGGPPVLYQVNAGFNLLGSSTAGPTIANTTTPCSPVTDILNPNALNPANPTGPAAPTEWIYASVATGGVTTGCGAGCIFNFVDTQRQPSTAYAVGQEVLDNTLHIEVVEAAGTSSAQPNQIFDLGCTTAGATRTDGTLVWLCQSSTKYGPPLLSAWASNHRYTTGAEIIDSNNNIELVTSITGNGNSGTSTPAFSLTPGGTVTAGTLPNTATFTNVGAAPSAALAASGGASGLIIDNFIVATGAEAGASQIYFTTLSDQTCATSGGIGGCAVQASQSALH
jgi:hypothetical protein